MIEVVGIAFIALGGVVLFVIGMRLPKRRSSLQVEPPPLPLAAASPELSSSDYKPYFAFFLSAGTQKRQQPDQNVGLRRYKYPPDKQEEATETVLKQAEALSEAWAA